MPESPPTFVARPLGILVGIGTHVLFAFTVWHLVWFLAGHGPRNVGVETSVSDPVGEAGRLAIDLGLAVLFAVPHSLLLLPAMRRLIVPRWIPGPFYGLFFCAATCVVLLTTIFLWRPSDAVLFAWPAAARPWITIAFVASWAALLYSLALTGLGHQTGWTPWWRWVRGLEPEGRSFEPRGAYRILRHPVYLSFLGLIWITPVVTLDRAVLIGTWTAYIYVGSVLKDRRLAHFLGAAYRGYAARVPGYPGMPGGPLARLPLATEPH
jgi:protein-S-isoprenylcysteine O-methyltransferase Ste14